MITGRERDRLLTAEAKPGGITYRAVAPDDGPPRTFVNKRTGEVSEVPAGIDPGWATNPGLSRAQTLVTRLNEQLAAAGDEDARSAIAAIAASPMPRVMAGLPEPVSLPVAVAPPSLSQGIAAGARIVEMDAKALQATANASGTDIGPKLFFRIQETLDTGIVTPGGDDERSLVAELPDGLWHAAVRGADLGRRLILSAFRLALARQA